MPDVVVPVPAWFTKAIAQPVESRFVELDGAAVHYLSWNASDTQKPGLLFAHGFRAHARWWSFIAPFFLSRFRVAAIDFPGMGDSAARKEYESLDFPRSLAAVLEHSGFGRSTLVGHSFGGSQVARASYEFPDMVERAVIIDSYIPVRGIGGRKPPPLEPRAKNVYATYETARARFRLVPEQNAAAPHVLDYIARHSMHEVAGGWSWKFDEKFVPRHREQDFARLASVVPLIQCPVTYIYGDQSIVVSRELAQGIVKNLKHGHGPIAVPQAHHHVLLDQPLSLVAALKAVLYL
jgi:pimeloyl-ACP methyl ester carboxylesterase